MEHTGGYSSLFKAWNERMNKFLDGLFIPKLSSETEKDCLEWVSEWRGREGGQWYASNGVLVAQRTIASKYTAYIETPKPRAQII